MLAGLTEEPPLAPSRCIDGGLSLAQASDDRTIDLEKRRSIGTCHPGSSAAELEKKCDRVRRARRHYQCFRRALSVGNVAQHDRDRRHLSQVVE